jgi:transposase-like protein
MKKRVIDLRDARPLLDIVSYGRGGRPPTAAQRQHVALTVRRAPEVMVKVSGGARTLAGVERHVAYIGRDGELGLEDDLGTRLDGKGFERGLIEDWNLDILALKRQTEHSIRGTRKPPKLVHNIIFSMPPGTSPKGVLRAVHKLAQNEWQFKHRYAMTLHTDDDHPHVHVVVKAVSETGERLNIKKATLRDWRRQFAANLRELGIEANATERAVRGETRTRKSDRIFRADQRNASTHMYERQQRVVRELSREVLAADDGDARLNATRREVVDGWHRVADRLAAGGDRELAFRVRSFVERMPPVRTEKALLADQMRMPQRGRHIDVSLKTQ